MRVLLSTVSAPHYMAPPILSDEQVNCGPFFEDRVIDGRVVSLSTPRGAYDLSLVASRLPADQQPDLVVCLIDSSWYSMPCNFSAFNCPKIALVADTHHMSSPILGMIKYLKAQMFDRHIFLYTRHHLEIFRAAGVGNLHWLPGLTFPHNDAMVHASRREQRVERVALIGQSGGLHPRRLALAGALARAGLPLVFREGTQREALNFYGSSLIGFNATANADLNLRAHEITAAGSLMLMDRLAPESGIAALWQDGREYVAYDSAAELVERAQYYIDRPEEARSIGAAAARWFDEHLNAPRRRQLFDRIVLDGRDDPMFALPAPSKFVRTPFEGLAARYVTALAVYEHLQKLHSSAEVVRVLADDTVPADFSRICATLPRLTVQRQFGPGEQPDCLVTNTKRALALTALDAPSVYCWDATPAQIPELAARFSSAGLTLLREDIAFFGLPAAVVRPAERLAAEARQRWQCCDAAGAFELARNALEQNPRSVDAYLIIAEISLENGKEDLFGKMIAKVKMLSPDDPRVPLLELAVRQGTARQGPAERLIASAVRHMSGADLPNAKNVAEHVIKVDPKLAAAWHWSGRISLQLAQRQVGATRQEEHSAGLYKMRHAVALAPSCADYWHELGLVLRQTGLLVEATEAFECATSVDPLDPERWIALGEVLLKNGEHERATTAFTCGLKHAPEDPRLLRLIDQSRKPSNPLIAIRPEERDSDHEVLPGSLASIKEILNNVGWSSHDQVIQLAAAFTRIARRNPDGLRLTGGRTLMAYQPWFGLDMSKLTRECLNRGRLLVVFTEDVRYEGKSSDQINVENFKVLTYRGVNLWLVSQYRVALRLGKMTEQIDPAIPADQAALADLYAQGTALIEKAWVNLTCYRPETIVIAQGYDLMSAVLRHLAIMQGLRVISLENIFRKDRLLWEDVSGISVNQNLARNYYWRHRDFVTDETASKTVATYLEQVKNAKSREHVSPTTRLPEDTGDNLPTITYLAQVGADSSVLFGLRGFISQIEVIVALATYAAARSLRLLIKLHPKENPAFRDDMTSVRGLTARGLAEHSRFAALRTKLGKRLVIDDSNRYDTYDMIRRAKVCVTINSQAGLEAAILGREVVLCGNAFYGTLGFTHEATDARSLEFVLDRVLREGLRLNNGPAARAFSHIFTEYYCLPKSAESVVQLLEGRPIFFAQKGGETPSSLSLEKPAVLESEQAALINTASAA